MQLKENKSEPIPIEVIKGKSYFWYSCGKSTKQPFCDGSHKGTSQLPMKFVANESKKIYFCTCKNTKKQPLCDGSYNK